MYTYICMQIYLSLHMLIYTYALSITLIITNENKYIININLYINYIKSHTNNYVRL